jgi:hypothetical protein
MVPRDHQPEEFRRDMPKLMAFSEQYDWPVDARESGILLLTHIDEERDAACRTIAPSLRGLPIPPDDIAARRIVGPAAEYVEKLQRFVEAGCVKFVLPSGVPRPGSGAN